MVTPAVDPRPLRLPDVLVRALVRHAERLAERTAACLLSFGWREAGKPRLSAAALLEFAALLELGVWERRGFRRYLDVDLPTYREAAGQLAARCRKDPAEFEGPNATPLLFLMLHVWVEHFAWDGPEILDADFILGDVDEEAFIDVLAEFVWSHRVELAKLLRIEGNKR